MTEVPQEQKTQITKQFLAEDLPLSRLKHMPYLGPRILNLCTYNNIRTYKDLEAVLDERVLIYGRPISALPAHGQRTIEELRHEFNTAKVRFEEPRIARLEEVIRSTMTKGNVIPEGVLETIAALGDRMTANENKTNALLAGHSATHAALAVN